MSSVRWECSLRVPIIDIQYTWRISTEDLTECIYMASTLYSPTFGESEWQLYLTKDTVNDGFLRLGIDRLATKTVRMRCRAWVLAANGTRINRREEPSFPSVSPDEIRSWPKFLRESDVSNATLSPCIVDGKLRIVCQLAVIPFDEVIKVADESDAVPLASDMRNLLDDGILTDVTLVAGERELKVHRAVLAARSPVFRSMFEANMMESRSGRVELTDISPEALGALISFIYTDTVSTREVRTPESYFWCSVQQCILLVKHVRTC